MSTRTHRGSGGALVFAIAVFSVALRPQDAWAQDPFESPSPETEPVAKMPEPAASTENAAANEEIAAPVSSSRAVRVQVAAGAGIGTRGLRRPTPYGAQRLNGSVFPALDVGVRVLVWPAEEFSLAFNLRYQTSIAWVVRDEPLFALQSSVHARAEHLELGVGPQWRLGDSPRALSLALPVGVSLRTLWPALHDLAVVGYSLLGPYARAELLITLGDALTLRVGPEAQWIISIDRAIQRDGTGSQGIALGGELALQIPLGRKLGLELSYRQAHAFVPGLVGRPGLTDVERFATARVSGSL